MPSPRANKSALIALAMIAGSLALAGCLAHDPFAPPTDPASAAAQQVNEAAVKDRPYPRWADFPAAPKDVPAPAQFAERVADAEASEAALKAAAADLVWTLEDTEGWLAMVRAYVDPALAAPAPPDAAAQTEAWAAETRARATPPPVAK